MILVAASKEVISAHHFLTILSSIVNIIDASCKRNDEFKLAQVAEIAHMIAINEVEDGRGLNQIWYFTMVADTHYGSHLRSVSSLTKMFSATCVVLLNNIIDEGATRSQWGEVDYAY